MVAWIQFEQKITSTISPLITLIISFKQVIMTLYVLHSAIVVREK